jgi:TRAP transporter TAXI family solute receptor
VSNVTQSIDAVILPFTEEEIKRFQKFQPYLRGVWIPAKTYRGQDKPVYTTGYSSLLMVRSDLDPDLIFRVIKTIYDHPDEIALVHPAGKDYALKNVYNGADHPYRLGLKFHPGTIKYLKEQKVWNSKYE